MKILILLFTTIGLLTPGFAIEPVSPPSLTKNFRVIETTKALYPLRMLEEGVQHGMAKAVLHINSKGELADVLVVMYSRKPFADEAERVIRKWKFESAYVNGEPIDTILEVSLNFEVNGIMIVQVLGAFAPSHTEFEPDYEYQACTLKKLDGIPTPIRVVTPTYPREWAEQGIVGNVVVDFYIDETGKTRFVAPASGANPMLAGIAVAAVTQWQFAPPTRKGKPVLVHAQQIFEFRKVGEPGK